MILSPLSQLQCNFKLAFRSLHEYPYAMGRYQCRDAAGYSRLSTTSYLSTHTPIRPSQRSVQVLLEWMMTVFDCNTRSSTIIIIIIIIIINYVSTALIISILSCIVISEQLERGCNLTVSLFYCCYICHFVSLLVLVSKKWCRLAQCWSLQARITLMSVSDILVHIFRFDLTNSVKLWLLFITTIMTTPSQDLDIALA